MNVLFDTHFLTDILFEKGDHLDDAVFLLDKAEKKRIDGWISAVSLTELHHFIFSKDTIDKTSDIVRNVLLIVRVVTVDEKIAHAALQSAISDYTLALIAESAKAANLDCIVSTNRALWEERGIRILTPKDLRTIIEYSGI